MTDTPANLATSFNFATIFSNSTHQKLLGKSLNQRMVALSFPINHQYTNPVGPLPVLFAFPRPFASALITNHKLTKLANLPLFSKLIKHFTWPCLRSQKRLVKFVDLNPESC